MADDELDPGDFLGAAGVCPEIEYNGTTYRVGHPTQKAKDQLTKLVAAVALQGAQQADRDMPGLGAVARLTDQITDRLHRPGRELWKRHALGPDGPKLFLCSLLRENHPDASLDLASALSRDRADEVAVALLLVVPRFFLLLAADPDLPPGWAEMFREKARELAAQSPAPPTPSSTTTSST